jgi:hypothetical protein
MLVLSHPISLHYHLHWALSGEGKHVGDRVAHQTLQSPEPKRSVGTGHTYSKTPTGTEQKVSRERHRETITALEEPTILDLREEGGVEGRRLEGEVKSSQRLRPQPGQVTVDASAIPEAPEAVSEVSK